MADHFSFFKIALSIYLSVDFYLDIQKENLFFPDPHFFRDISLIYILFF